MSIDSQEKRMAAASAGRPWMRATFPSGTIDQEERISIGHGYGGNAIAGAVEATGGAMTAMSAMTGESAMTTED